MPNLSESVRKDIEERLAAYLKDRQNYGTPHFVDAGGSAAIYRIDTPDGARAIKVYDPKFFADSNAKAERRRLKLQQSLIGHNCETLVHVFGVEEDHGTGFIEMEFVDWPQLKSVLANVPDPKIATLINQLVLATKFLESLDIVHRDIKPENIHVSSDFSHLKLIDLGVARALSIPDEDSDDATDHGHRRPFIATMQYSSPEYLFRLDAPSPELWRALNLYQVGGVLHDLINKRPLFDYEVGLDNKWLVARAVLTKTPTYPDADPLRLVSLKALAARCLVKDMTTRLKIVSWSDFAAEAPIDSLSLLKSKLAKGKGLASANVATSANEKLRFDRTIYCKNICQALRTELIPALDGAIRLTLSGPTELGYTFEFSINPMVALVCHLRFEWETELQPHTATISLSGELRANNGEMNAPDYVVVHAATIDSSDDVTCSDLASRFATLLASVIDMTDSVMDHTTLHGVDIAKTAISTGVSNGH